MGEPLTPETFTDFYPRPPRGGRRYAGFFVLAGRLISIHALREEGDKNYGKTWDILQNISIHALREEGDDGVQDKVTETAQFLSTPSARRATLNQSL